MGWHFRGDVVVRDDYGIFCDANFENLDFHLGAQCPALSW